MERMVVAIARRWRYYEASILLKSEALISLYLLVVGFLVDCRCGSVGFDLDWLVFSSWLVGLDDLAADWVGDDLAWLGFGLGGWWMGLGLSGLIFLDDAGWVVMMVAGCGVIVGSDGLWVCEREGQWRRK